MVTLAAGNLCSGMMGDADRSFESNSSACDKDVQVDPTGECERGCGVNLSPGQ